ncbi:Phosphate-selective porin O and P [Chitinophaga jiangningensis]|uniref:Phosphate-selective porin O and P n=1 Tax=Chitinophaga jiangningensis TaxID=1419482 RepID=A0A1M7M8L3_9BACT|nr:porin [Chitinophaga jiangningensis]SHM87114.1 Phosphate-selective porin O and P [Chitinophaga jiangningensis]
MSHYFCARKALTILSLPVCCLLTNKAFGQYILSDTTNKVSVQYGEKGFEFRTRDDKFLLQIQSRFQFRFATPEDQDPVTYDDFMGDNKTSFKINRARLKVGGHAFKPWIKYYWEYELSQSNLLNFTLSVEKWEWLKFQVGQFKVEYSRERRISSGEQQMVDRSVINRPFTVDRQQGAEIYGRLKGRGVADFNYWLGVFTGTGRGSTQNDDNHLMYFTRLQWNFTGDYLDFEGSDIEIHERPAGVLAVNSVTNRSPYTRFSQAGGGSLEGYENGLPGQYRVNQANVETAFMYKGFSWQMEYHWKEIVDKLNNDETNTLHGYYVQAGYFFHQAIDWWPAPLEVAARNAGYFPNREEDQTKKRETSLAFNWFFHKHKNKLTMETSYFNYDKTGDIPASEWRFRLQWDISL